MDEGRGGLGLADSGSFEKPDTVTDPSPSETARTVAESERTQRMTRRLADRRNTTRKLSDMPTLKLPTMTAAATTLASLWSRILQRARFQSAPASRGRARRAIIVSVIMLFALGLPGLVAASAALNEYHQIKALGEDGLARLSAVKTDLLGSSKSTSTASTSSGLTSSLSGSNLGSSLLAELQTVLTAPGPDVVNPAYTYLVQRQSGTLYPLDLTIHPAQGVASEGTSAANFNGTVSGNTYVALGGTPKPTPPAPTTTPTPSPTTAATPTSGGSTSGASSLKSRIPDQAHITKARSDLLAAQADFVALDGRLAHPDWVLSLAAVIPHVTSYFAAGQTLAHIGVDGTQAALAMLDAATPLMLRLHATSSLLSSPEQLINETDITALSKGLVTVSSKVDDIVALLKTINVNSLPLSAKQKATFTEIKPLLPQIKTLADQAIPLLQVFGWVIGADATRHFLIQTLDRGELRATGGFTGQYAVLTITGGKLGPLSLQDVNCLDYLTGCLSNGWIFGRRPPAPYNSWWPFANWGLRDSNLNADFPTDARMVLDVYQHESGQQMDGLIDISPLAIEDVLRVTGPIYVPLYNETITADNLETKLHYYQQDPAAIALQKQISGGGRKSFTELVGQLLQAQVKALPFSMMAPLAKLMIGDMRSKNLEVYFTDPATEALLTKYSLDGAVNTTPGVDGYMLVQANVSVSKASTFIDVTQHDTVTLDAQGGATHLLKLTFHGNYVYTQVWGYLTYRDYLRIYVPPQSRLIWGDGFDSGTPMCWPPSAGTAPTQYATLTPCVGNPYPYNEMSCPSGDYAPGPRAPDVFGSDGYMQWPVDQPGGPTNTTSDIANRAMYGGYIFVPDGCTATVTLKWYTPGVAPKA